MSEAVTTNTTTSAHDHGHDHAHAHAHAHAAAPATPATTDGEEPIIALTKLAADKVLEIRQAEGIEENMGLRLRVVGGGCSGFSYDLYFDTKADMDRELVVHGVQVYVDQMSLMYLMGTEIDYVEGLQGAGFKFNNPNVKSSCGCGSSVGF